MKPFDSTGAFLPVTEKSEIRRQAVRGAGVTVFSQGLMFAIQLLATLILARLLTPADFGVVTMVTTFSLLLVGFGMNGFTEAVLHRPTIDHFLASNLYWINVGVGLLLSIAFAASGSLLAKFYGDPKVTPVAVGMAFAIALSSTSVLHLTLLKRAMKFSSVSAADLAGRAISVAVSIFLGWQGWGYRALVAGAIAQPLVVSIVAYWQCRWIPAFPRPAAGTREVLRYALHVYGRYSLNYATRNTDNLLVGWRFGTQSLGLYKKAYDLFLLPASQLLAPVSSVAISSLSRLNNDWAEYKRSFLVGLGVLAFVGMGLGACLTIVSTDLIRLLLGPGWEMSGRIFMFFGPGMGIMLVYGAHGLIHLSIGSAQRWFRWGLIEFAVTILFFLIALPWGPVGLAAAWTLSFWVLAVPAFWYAGKPIDLGVGQIVWAVWRYVLASLLAGVVTAQTVIHLPEVQLDGAAGAAYRVAIDSVVFAIFYLGAVILFHGGTSPLRHFAHILQTAFSTGNASELAEQRVALLESPLGAPVLESDAALRYASESHKDASSAMAGDAS